MNIEKQSKYIIVVLVIFFFSFSASAQNDKGRVLDSNYKKPLSGVNIYVKDKKIGTTSNDSGFFYLNNFDKLNENDTIYFSYIGFTTQKVSFSNLKLNSFIVFLSENFQNINEVKIILNQTLKSQIQYKRLTSLNEGLYSFGSLMLGNSIYIIGGNSSCESNEALRAYSLYGEDFLKKIKPDFSWQNYIGRMYIYDILSDKWIYSNIKFNKRAFHNINYYDGKIIVLGGKRLSKNKKKEYLDENVEVYDINRDTIIIDKTNPHQAVNFASAIYDSNLIVIGGSTKLKPDGNKEYSCKAHLLNIKTGYWYDLGEMPRSKETKGILIKNKIYLIGGFNINPLKEIETYNINTGEWHAESYLYYPVERPGIAFNNDIIYIFENGIIQTYNIKTKELSAYSIDLYLKYSEIFFNNNKLYIIGGFFSDEFSITPSPYIYVINISEFIKTKKIIG